MSIGGSRESSTKGGRIETGEWVSQSTKELSKSSFLREERKRFEKM